LILTRKTGQSIILNDDIEVTVVQVRGEQVRLGITAPRSVRVSRRELLDEPGDNHSKSRSRKADDGDDQDNGNHDSATSSLASADG